VDCPTHEIHNIKCPTNINDFTVVSSRKQHIYGCYLVRHQRVSLQVVGNVATETDRLPCTAPWKWQIMLVTNPGSGNLWRSTNLRNCGNSSVSIAFIGKIAASVLLKLFINQLRKHSLHGVLCKLFINSYEEFTWYFWCDFFFNTFWPYHGGKVYYYSTNFLQGSIADYSVIITKLYVTGRNNMYLSLNSETMFINTLVCKVPLLHNVASWSWCIIFSHKREIYRLMTSSLKMR